MYAGNEGFIQRIMAARAQRVGFVNRPKGWTDSPVSPETVRPTGLPVRPWTGNWKPRHLVNVRTMGTLGEDIPLMPATVPATVQTPGFAPIQANADGGGWLSDLFAGLGKVITPAAQALVGIKAQGLVQQQTQRTLAQTYNPAITAPAIQAQAWQTAFQSGAGVTPTAAISGTTLALLGVAALGVYLIARK